MVPAGPVAIPVQFGGDWPAAQSASSTRTIVTGCPTGKETLSSTARGAYAAQVCPPSDRMVSVPKVLPEPRYWLIPWGTTDPRKRQPR